MKLVWLLSWMVVSMEQMDAIEYDVERTKFLEALGLTVIRYWNHDVLSRTNVVLADLWRRCSELK